MPKIKLYSSQKVYIFAIILALAWCALIFFMSNEPATESAERSGSIADILAPIFVSGFEELEVWEKEDILLDIDHIVRKTAHFCVFAFLGAVFTFASLWHSRTWFAHLSLPWICGALYAASDEFHQAFVPGRGARFSDVVLDSAGVLFGALFVLVLARVLLRRKS